jgi:hypothetical protein
VGLHRPTSADPKYRQLAPEAASAYYRKILAAMVTYGDAVEMPKPISDKMLATGSGEIAWVNTSEEHDLERAPSSGEWADASCGRMTQAEDQLLSRLLEKNARGLVLAADEAAALKRLQDKQLQHNMCQFALRSAAVDALPPP